MPAPLDKTQKRYLSQLARRAWQKAGPELDGQREEDYRREQVVKACGKHGLRCCSQDDYGAVKAHFLDALGESGKALTALVHQEGNKRRVAEYKLVTACQQARVTLAYAARICQTQFKCTLELASEKQLWCLMYTVQNRGRKAAAQK